MNVCEPNDRSIEADKKKVQAAILQGNYRLKMNPFLPTPKKIERFAQEPVAFYLHKKRDFLTRVSRQEEELRRAEEKRRILAEAMERKPPQRTSQKEQPRRKFTFKRHSTNKNDSLFESHQ